MPIDKPMLSKLLGALDFTVPGKHHRALYKAMFCLAFHAFLRIGEMTVQSANAANPNLLQWKQLEIKDTSLTVTVTFIHFKHSKGELLTLTIKGTTSPQDCPLQIMKAYLSVRGATADPYICIAPACLSRAPSLTSSYGEPYSFVISAPNSLNHIAFV